MMGMRGAPGAGAGVESQRERYGVFTGTFRPFSLVLSVWVDISARRSCDAPHPFALRARGLPRMTAGYVGVSAVRGPGRGRRRFDVSTVRGQKKED